MFSTLDDNEIRDLHNGYKAAVKARKELIEWTSGDTSARKELVVTVSEHGQLIANEFRRRFPDECRPRFTRTRAVFS